MTLNLRNMPRNTRNNSNNKIQFIYGRREPGSRSIKPLETSSYRGEKKKKRKEVDNGSLIAGFSAEAARGSSSLEITLYVPRGPALITKYSIVRHGVLLMIERYLEMLKRPRQERKKKKKRKMSATSCKTSYLLMMATVAEVVSREDCQDGHSLHARAPVCAASTKFPFNLVKTAPR